MRTSVTFQTPAGEEVVLVPGDLVGRMPRCALRVEDPRISEAHALVTLRGAELRLLALRGRLGVGGKAVTEVALGVGSRVLLGGFYTLVVTAVDLPDTIYALALGDAAPLVIERVTMLRFVDGELRASAGFDPHAAATVWVSERGVHIRRRDEADEEVLEHGGATLIAGVRVAVQLVDNLLADQGVTAQQGQFDVPLRIVSHYDTVHIYPADGSAIVLDGFAARLVTELGEIGTLVAWGAVASALWPDESDSGILRQRWDQTTSRIRKRLRDGRVRTDLVRANGTGLVELYLGPRDRFEDRS